MLKFCIIIAFLALINALPKEDGHKDRVFDGDLSDKQHFEHEEHNAQYDHEAFLGEDAKTFDQLSPEESKRRLGIIAEKIDNNKDGFISREELKDWIKFTQKRYIATDVNRQWQQHNPDDMPLLSWASYEKNVYGFLDHPIEQPHDSVEEKSYKAMRKRDRRRWSVADSDGDDSLTKEEFSNFLHPEEHEHMKMIVVEETMEDIDKDGDGKISIEEYVGDMYKPEEGEEEPDWVKSEKEQFTVYRDKNGDGYMDQDEVKNWILPEDFDHADAEARHLIYEADQDVDEQLTKEEVLSKYDLFVGSQATDFGEALARHEEL